MTSVGAILLLFGAFPSTLPPLSCFSLSISPAVAVSASRLPSDDARTTPPLPISVDTGVIGGVVSGSPPAKPAAPLAVTLGTFPMVGAGELTTKLCDTCVAIEETELERDFVGLAMKAVEAGEAAGFSAAAGSLERLSADTALGVGRGAGWGVCVTVRGEWWWWCDKVGTCPAYTWPSSPGAKLTAEQKPSEDVIRRVRPSVDLWMRLAFDYIEDGS